MAQTFVRDVAEGRDAKPYVQRVLLWQTIVTASGRSARYHWLNNSLGRRSLIRRWCNPLKCKLFQVVVRSSLSNQDEHKLKSTGTQRPTTTSTTLRAYRSRILVVHCPAPGPLSFSRSPLHPPIYHCPSFLFERQHCLTVANNGERYYGVFGCLARTMGTLEQSVCSIAQ